MKHYQIHKLLLFLLILITISSPALGKSKVIIGCDNNYPPYEFVNKDGQIVGYNIDLIKVIAAQYNIDIEFRSGVWNEILAAFEKSEIDILSGIFYTNERTQKIDFSIPHSMISYIIFYRNGEIKIETEKDLSGKKILVQKDDLAYKWLIEHNFSAVGVESPKEAIQSLSAGNFDCAILSKIVGLYYCNKLKIKNIAMSESAILQFRYCFAAHKEDRRDLIYKINEGIVYIKENGIYNQIQDKWFGVISEENFYFTTFLNSAIFILIPILVLIVFLLFWTRQLRKQVRKSVKELEIELAEKLKAEHLQNALFRISEGVSASKGLKGLYLFIHNIVNELVPANNFYISIYDENRDVIEFPYFVDEFDPAPESRPPKRGLTEYVLFTGKPLLCSPEIFMQMIADEKIDQLGAPSVDWLGIPLKIENKVIGVIVVQSYIQGIRFTKDDESLLLFVSNQIAMAIERKRAEQEILALNSELEMRVIERTHQLEETLEELTYENAERKRTQEALEQAQEEIELALIQEKELNELKSRFISIVSHEYRTPLTVILSSTYLIERFFEMQNKPEFVKSLKNIQSSVKSMTKLLDDVLTIGKTEAGRIVIVKSEINIVKISQSIIEDMKLTDKHNHIFKLYSDNEDIIIMTDLNILGKILTNLLSNAIKYSGANTEISTEIYDKKSFVQINVIDHGIGIPVGEREQIFESYHRFKNVGAISGTGLGLSIVKRFVDLLRGSISVESEEGQGSTFSVILPKHE